MSDAPTRVSPGPQHYDFASGELRSGFTYQVDGTTADVSVITFCARSHPSVVAQLVDIRVDHDADIEVRAAVEPGDAVGRLDHREVGVPGAGSGQVDGSFRWHPAGDLSTAGFAWATTFEGGDGVHRVLGTEREGPARTTYQLDARAGTVHRLVQLTAMVPDAVHAQPDREAARLATLTGRMGLDELRRRNRAEWEEIWKGRLVLLGADSPWQAAADAAHFYLHTSAHRSSLASTYIFGLANWHDYHYYYGHVMWDIEAFAVPALLLTQPDAARSLLEYRWRSLPAARQNARLQGYGGAQFPWESSPMRGEESAPADASGALYEHHVSMVVAHAFAQYVRATGDRRFEVERAWPVLADVADWIVSRVTASERGMELREVLGIAEREQPSDIVSFVAMAASVALSDALETADRLGRTANPAWELVRSGLVLPVSDGVVLDHDGYTPDEDKGSTPATLCGLFPMGYELPVDQRVATERFYLAMADDYLGSPMLSALYGAWAARAGDRELASRLFEEGFADFVSPRFHNVHEYRHDKFPEHPVAGPFTANLAAFLTSCLYGLTGLELSGAADGWCRRPVVMPSAWQGVSVERLWVQGQPMSLEARHGDPHATLTPL